MFGRRNFIVAGALVLGVLGALGVRPAAAYHGGYVPTPAYTLPYVPAGYGYAPNCAPTVPIYAPPPVYSPPRPVVGYCPPPRPPVVVYPRPGYCPPPVYRPGPWGNRIRVNIGFSGRW